MLGDIRDRGHIQFYVSRKENEWRILKSFQILKGCVYRTKQVGIFPKATVTPRRV